jgi:PAS domain S-box-containing protein
MESKVWKDKRYFQKIFDSSSDIIFSIDEYSRVTIWNKTAEITSGYKPKDILQKDVHCLDVFENPEELLEIIEKITSGEKIDLGNLILRTKNGVKRTLQVSKPVVTKAEGKGDSYDVMFVGRDVTAEYENLKGLRSGNCYLIEDKSEKNAIQLLENLVHLGHHGLLITRSSSHLVKPLAPSEKIRLMFLQENLSEKYDFIGNLEILVTKIIRFIEVYPRSAVLLSRVDSLITKHSFEDFLDTLYQIDDVIVNTDSLFIIHVNPSILDGRELSVLEEELQVITDQKIDDLVLEDSLYDLLTFIHEEEVRKSIVSFKKIRWKLNLTYPTIRKRLVLLKEQGLITIRKQGRTKEAHITEKGRRIIVDRVTPKN